MCIAYFDSGNPQWPLFIAANRDEFHSRPTQSARYWTKNSNIISGIDLQGGGTWLGVTKTGRFAFLTNYRDLDNINPDATSRGNLVSDFLDGDLSPKAYIDNIFNQSNKYNGFNLIVGNLVEQYYLTNSFGIKPDYEPYQEHLKSGQYILSNHLLNTPWPKSTLLFNSLKKLDMHNLDLSFNQVFSILKNTSQPDDALLPNTGVGIELERLLSSPFIISDDYGTRCSSVIAIHKSGCALFSEVSYNNKGIETGRSTLPFRINA